MEQTAILAKVKRLRKERGLSQAEMADALHIALKTYQNIEGGITRIDIERLGQIATVLEVTLHDLVGSEKPPHEDVERLIAEEKALYNKIIHDKEAYIAQLEDSIRFYREMLREGKTV
ncbi:helix-turn-helix domain-containing protein [Parapedobacter sp. 10938]|uniref:helix-turn-helix domain-containing protein n=1 Tax=Parapedobacter flavus TaxID=3110225 RepID=UPI002DBA272F|nr:helix-turn-helix transcriptional regulator [Parapedobacter sp. 10938]MEC3880781.1 helix-turn-helix transcriptional regulator [Parapedobacter sp. 10938]